MKVMTKRERERKKTKDFQHKNKQQQKLKKGKRQISIQKCNKTFNDLRERESKHHVVSGFPG